MKRNACYVLLLAFLVGCQSGLGRYVGLQKMRAAVSSAIAHDTSASTPSIIDPETKLVSAHASVLSQDDIAGDAGAIQAVSFETDPAPEPVVLTLESAWQTSLQRNPDLIALRAQEPVSQAAYRVAQTYPFNPSVQVQVLPYTKAKDDGTLAVDNSVAVLQTIELAHQSRHRISSAGANINQVRWKLVNAELLNIAQTERLFFTAAYQREIWELEKADAELNEKLLHVIQRRFEAGPTTQTSAADVTMARVNSRSSRLHADLAEANYQTALLALRQHLNFSPNTPLQLAADLNDWDRLVPAERSLRSRFMSNPPGQDDEGAALAANRPDVLAARAAVDVARANADLAEASKCPNVAIGPYYERDEAGTLKLGINAQMDLPVWNTGDPLARQRWSEYRQQLVTLEQLQQKAAAEARAAVERYQRARRLLEQTNRTAPTPLADESASIQRQFEAGRIDVLTVLATQRSLVQDRRIYLDLLNELAQAGAEVTQATGLFPEPVPVPPAPAEEQR